MARAPSRYLIVGQKVLNEVKARAPDDVKRSFAKLLEALEAGPYPGNHMLHATPAKGYSQKHLYVAWYDNVEIMYLVMQDQPVVSLVEVHWDFDNDTGGSGGGVDYEGWPPPKTPG
jgi:hypothetical protein